MPSVDVGLTITAINNATGAIRDVSGQVKTLGENAQATSNRLKAIQVVIAGILISKTLEYGKALVAASIAQQNVTIQLTRFAGSAAAASKVQSDLNSKFAAAPFHIDTINTAWTRLRSTMQSNDAATKVVSAITNDVIAMGGTDQNINNLAESFQRLFGRGYASAREYVGMLQQTGLTLGDLAKAAGTTSTNLERNLRAGFVNATQFVDMFVKASEQRFGDLSKGLKNTTGGSFMAIQNAFDEGLQGLGERTDLNVRLAGVFNNIADAVTKFMGSIDQSKIDALFNWFAQVEPLIRKAAVSMYNIITTVVTLGGDIAQMLGMMPQEALEMGMIGYFLFGKKGAALLALLGAVGTKAHEVVPMMNAQPGGMSWGQTYGATYAASAKAGSKYMGNFLGPLLAVPDAGIKTLLAKGVQGLFNAAPDMSTITGVQASISKSAQGGTGSILPNQKQIDESKKSLADFFATLGKINGPQATGISSKLADAMVQVTNAVREGNDVLDQMHEKIDQLHFQNTGDQLGATIAGLKVQGAASVKAIDTEIAKLTQLKLQTTDTKNLVTELTKEREREVKVMNDAIEKAKQTYAIQKSIFLLQQQLTQSQNQYAMKTLQQNTNGNPLANMMMGSSGGQAMLAVQQQHQQYSEQIIGYDTQIKELESQINGVLADPAKVSALQATIQSVTQLRDGTAQALNNLSVNGQLQRDMWKSLGDAISNDVSNGIVGMIQGTKTLGDVARSVFGDMMSLAIKYFMQLLEIKAIQTIGMAFGDGGTVAGGVAFANGGITPHVKPFANGDIVSGPTLFGLAGEAGTEAIMPLTRIGGKLGVRSSGGGGGDNLHVTIQAIDTQSGMDFLAKHVDAIGSQLAQRNRLNRQKK